VLALTPLLPALDRALEPLDEPRVHLLRPPARPSTTDKNKCEREG